MMLPPFGGVLRCEGECSRETLSSALAAALAAGVSQDAAAVPLEGDAPVVWCALEHTEMVYAVDLSRAVPWSAVTLPPHEALGLLARVARTLSALHGVGRVHGEVRPEMVALDPTRGVLLLVPVQPSAPGAWLRARLHPGGAAPSTVAFAAPEVVDGTAVTTASDVFSLAALVHATLTASVPLGQINLPPYALGPFDALARCVAEALDHNAARRPQLAALTDALAQAAAGAVSPDPRRLSGASTARSTSPVLLATLLVGGAITLLGTILLVSIGWSTAGVVGRGLLLVGLSLGSWAVGALAQRFHIDAGVIVARAISAVFATIATGFVFSNLDEPGRLGLLVVLTVAALGGGARATRHAPLGGLALVGLGTQLGWAVGAQWMHMGSGPVGSGEVAVLAGLVAGVTYALGLWRRAQGLVVLATLDLVVFFAALGHHLRTGSVMGLPAYTLAVAAGYAVLAAGASRRGPDTLGSPLALLAGIGAALSACAGVFVMAAHPETHRLPGAVWPYGVALAAALLSRGAGSLGTVALWVAGAVVVLAPTAEAMVYETLPMAVGAVGFGAAVVLGALVSAREKRGHEAPVEVLLVGLLGMLAVPGLRLVSAMLHTHEDGDVGRWGALVGTTALGLLATAFVATGRVARDNHRLLELAAVVTGLGALSLQVLCTLDPIEPALATLGCAAVLAVYGWFGRRAVVFVAGTLALLVHGWVQYFVRLEAVLPMSIRLVGFGVGLLVAGVVYEQRLRPRVAALRQWH